jgi:hypothetical protein
MEVLLWIVDVQALFVFDGDAGFGADEVGEEDSRPVRDRLFQPLIPHSLE